LKTVDGRNNGERNKMNKVRRDRIAKVIDCLNNMRAEIEDICADEGFALEGIQEHFAETERCQRMEEIVDALEEAAAEVESAIANLEECLQ